MATSRRTPKEIEKDLNKIREAAKTARSYEDIKRMTDLSVSQIKTTLKKHPIIFKDIQQRLLNNQNPDEKTNNEIESTSTNSGVSRKRNLKYFVIDASMSGVADLKVRISEIIASKNKIILTSLTIRELEKLQNKLEGARYLLREGAKHPESFKCVLIDEELPVPDDRLIKFCADNYKKVILLSADKSMVLKARTYNVKAEYFEFGSENKTSTSSDSSDLSFTTLKVLKMVNEKLVIQDFHTSQLSIRVLSEGREYNQGPLEIHLGDDVYIARNNYNDTFTFWHYKIVSLAPRNNSKDIYQNTIRNSEPLDKIKKSYQSFVRAFKYRHNL